jgi:hypothetical protein
VLELIDSADRLGWEVNSFMPRQPGSAGWQQRGRHAPPEVARLDFAMSAEDVVRRIRWESARHDRQVAAGSRPLGVAMDEPAMSNDDPSSPVLRLARRHPSAMFLVIALSLSLPVMIALLVSGQDISPGALLGSDLPARRRHPRHCAE